MSESDLPGALRFNPWGEWRALAVRLPDDHLHRVEHRCRQIRSRDVAAVFQYFSLTGYLGIEFVVVTSYVDPAPFRRFGDDLVLVPCQNVLAAATEPSGPPSHDLLYDGWLQLFDSSEDAMVSGLRRVDEVVAMIGHAHGCQSRWIVKYSEARDPHLHRIRQLTDVDREHLAQGTAKLHHLPTATRAAVVRAMTWVSQSRRRVRQSDRFLALWLAMESLVLSLYKDATALGLPIATIKVRPGDKRGPSIKKRTEGTLAAMFGERDPAVTWPYAEFEGDTSPADVRAAIVHEGLSGVDAAIRWNLDALGDTLEGIVEAGIARTLECKWGGAVPAQPPRTFSFSIPLDGVSNSRGYTLIEHDVGITPALLWRKGHL